jgi:hypothetical protein
MATKICRLFAGFRIGVCPAEDPPPFTIWWCLGRVMSVAMYQIVSDPYYQLSTRWPCLLQGIGINVLDYLPKF